MIECVCVRVKKGSAQIRGLANSEVQVLHRKIQEGVLDLRALDSPGSLRPPVSHTVSRP